MLSCLSPKSSLQDFNFSDSEIEKKSWLEPVHREREIQRGPTLTTSALIDHNQPESSIQHMDIDEILQKYAKKKAESHRFEYFPINAKVKHPFLFCSNRKEIATRQIEHSKSLESEISFANLMGKNFEIEKVCSCPHCEQSIARLEKTVHSHVLKLSDMERALHSLQARVEQMRHEKKGKIDLVISEEPRYERPERREKASEFRKIEGGFNSQKQTEPVHVSVDLHKKDKLHLDGPLSQDHRDSPNHYSSSISLHSQSNKRKKSEEIPEVWTGEIPSKGLSHSSVSPIRNPKLRDHSFEEEHRITRSEIPKLTESIKRSSSKKRIFDEGPQTKNSLLSSESSKKKVISHFRELSTPPKAPKKEKSLKKTSVEKKNRHFDKISIKFVGKLKNCVFDFRSKRVFGWFPEEVFSRHKLNNSLGFDIEFSSDGKCRFSVLFEKVLDLSKGILVMMDLGTAKHSRSSFKNTWKEEGLDFYKKNDMNVSSLVETELMDIDGLSVGYEDLRLIIQEVEVEMKKDLVEFVQEKGLRGSSFNYQNVASLIHTVDYDREKQSTLIQDRNFYLGVNFEQQSYVSQLFGSKSKGHEEYTCLLKPKISGSFSLTQHTAPKTIGGTLQCLSETQAEVSHSLEALEHLEIVCLKHIGTPSVIPFVQKVFGTRISPFLYEKKFFQPVAKSEIKELKGILSANFSQMFVALSFSTESERNEQLEQPSGEKNPLIPRWFSCPEARLALLQSGLMYFANILRAGMPSNTSSSLVSGQPGYYSVNLTPQHGFPSGMAATKNYQHSVGHLHHTYSSVKAHQNEKKRQGDGFRVEDIYHKGLGALYARKFVLLKELSRSRGECEVPDPPHERRRFSRPNSTWDFAMEEIKLKAYEIHQENKFRVAVSFHLAKSAKKHSLKIGNYRKVMSVLHKLISSKIAASVEKTWIEATRHMPPKAEFVPIENMLAMDDSPAHLGDNNAHPNYSSSNLDGNYHDDRSFNPPPMDDLIDYDAIESEHVLENERVATRQGRDSNHGMEIEGMGNGNRDYENGAMMSDNTGRNDGGFIGLMLNSRRFSEYEFQDQPAQKEAPSNIQPALQQYMFDIRRLNGVQEHYTVGEGDASDKKLMGEVQKIIKKWNIPHLKSFLRSSKLFTQPEPDPSPLPEISRIPKSVSMYGPDIKSQPVPSLEADFENNGNQAPSTRILIENSSEDVLLPKLGHSISTTEGEQSVFVKKKREKTVKSSSGVFTQNIFNQREFSKEEFRSFCFEEQNSLDFFSNLFHLGASLSQNTSQNTSFPRSIEEIPVLLFPDPSKDYIYVEPGEGEEPKYISSVDLPLVSSNPSSFYNKIRKFQQGLMINNAEENQITALIDLPRPPMTDSSVIYSEEFEDEVLFQTASDSSVVSRPNQPIVFNEFLLYYVIKYQEMYGNNWSLIADAINSTILCKGLMITESRAIEIWIASQIMLKRMFIDYSSSRIVHQPIKTKNGHCTELGFPHILSLVRGGLGSRPMAGGWMMDQLAQAIETCVKQEYHYGDFQSEESQKYKKIKTFADDIHHGSRQMLAPVMDAKLFSVVTEEMIPRELSIQYYYPQDMIIGIKSFQSLQLQKYASQKMIPKDKDPRSKADVKQMSDTISRLLSILKDKKYEKKPQVDLNLSGISQTSNISSNIATLPVIKKRKKQGNTQEKHNATVVSHKIPHELIPSPNDPKMPIVLMNKIDLSKLITAKNSYSDCLSTPSMTSFSPGPYYTGSINQATVQQANKGQINSIEEKSTIQSLLEIEFKEKSHSFQEKMHQSVAIHHRPASMTPQLSMSGRRIPMQGAPMGQGMVPGAGFPEGFMRRVSQMPIERSGDSAGTFLDSYGRIKMRN